jgi:glycosyltransferase involved in cell wall biosynthesis
MDVAIIAAARFAISEPFAGGMEVHTHVLADALAARGHHVTVYAAGGEGRFDVERLLPVGFDVSDAARRDVSAGPTATLSEHHSYLDAVLRLVRARHQLVHINAVHHLPFACSPLLPSVVTGTLHSPPTPWLESALALAARQVNPPVLVSVSRANAAAWTGVDISHVIGNGVDLQTWRAGPGGTAAVWTGRLVPEKAPHLAIDAARRAGLELQLVGPLHDETYFHDEIRPRLGHGIEYLGHMPTLEVASLVGRSSVAVVTPRWEEPFGLVVAEALACGTPVAGFARGALPELVDARTGVLAAPDDVAGLAQAMLDAATLSRRTCRSVAVERFSSTAMVDAYESWFADLVEQRS